MAVCGACQTYSKLGVIAGKSGYGKSHTLIQYAQLPKVAYIECDETMSQRDLVDTIAGTLGINAGIGSLFQRTEPIKNHLRKKEAEEYLSQFPMEEDVRDALISRACETRRGCFRRLDQTLDNAVRLVEGQGIVKITAQILEEASDMMLI